LWNEGRDLKIDFFTRLLKTVSFFFPVFLKVSQRMQAEPA